MRIISALFFVLLISIALVPHAFTQENDDAAIRAAVEKSIPLLQGLGPLLYIKRAVFVLSAWAVQAVRHPKQFKKVGL
jgi:hypothetical protein